jgi:hypothetical protein
MSIEVKLLNFELKEPEEIHTDFIHFNFKEPEFKYINEYSRELDIRRFQLNLPWSTKLHIYENHVIVPDLGKDKSIALHLDIDYYRNHNYTYRAEDSPFYNIKGSFIMDNTDVIPFKIVNALSSFYYRTMIHFNTDVLTSFIKLVFNNIAGVVKIQNNFGVSFLSSFLRDVLCLRKPINIAKATRRNFLRCYNINKYIKAVIYIREERMSRVMKTNTKTVDEIFAQIERERLEKNMSFEDYIMSYRRKNKIGYIGDSIGYMMEHIYDNLGELSDIYYNHAKFCSPEITDINYILAGNPVFSHFTKTYNNLDKNYYAVRNEKLISNKFYDDMLANMKYLDADVRDMLMTNLYVLQQNN